MKFGEYIRRVREDKGWTQPIAAEKAGIEQSYLSKLETGKSFPSEEMFDKLVETFGLNTKDLTQNVDSSELRELDKLKSVRAVISEQLEQGILLSRKWMMAGLVGFLLAGASIGAALVPQTAERQYLYRSHGVLKNDEPLLSFNAIYFSDSDEKTEMLKRIDQHRKLLRDYRGKSFVEETAEGRRFYELYAEPVSDGHSLLRYFIIPGCMFLLGSLGCFLIAFRWRRPF